jgi:hypothetical protein
MRKREETAKNVEARREDSARKHAEKARMKEEEAQRRKDEKEKMKREKRLSGGQGGEGGVGPRMGREREKHARDRMNRTSRVWTADEAYRLCQVLLTCGAPLQGGGYVRPSIHTIVMICPFLDSCYGEGRGWRVIFSPSLPPAAPFFFSLALADWRGALVFGPRDG